MSVRNSEQLRRLVESVELDASFAGALCEVDLLAERPTSGLPLMVQFLVGHPTVSYVIVHDDGVAHIARLKDDDAVEVTLRYERTSGVRTFGPETSTVPAALVVEIVQALCRTGKGPDYVRWEELPMD